MIKPERRKAIQRRLLTGAPLGALTHEERAYADQLRDEYAEMKRAGVTPDLAGEWEVG